MYLKEINHLAFITEDIVKTIRFYRDLLGMRLTHGVGHDGYRHYFFKTGNNYIAFFEYAGAQPMQRKFHGKPTSEPAGFDHVSISVASKEDLFALKDRLEAAGVEVHGAVDHGFGWSIYFFDNNNIPLEATWEFLELTKTPAMAEEQPLDIVAEGAEAQPGVWPEVTRPTPPERMVAHAGNGYTMRETFLKQGLARTTEDFGEAAE
jgi:catechol 2,3-dioxygenase-like lactoylglutathione lyase family enzyme